MCIVRPGASDSLDKIAYCVWLMPEAA